MLKILHLSVLIAALASVSLLACKREESSRVANSHPRGGSRPECSGNNGRGFGTPWSCDQGTCAKNKADFTDECVVGGSGGQRPPCTANGGKGYGSEWSCTEGTCAKDTPDYRKECVVTRSSGTSSRSELDACILGGQDSQTCTRQMSKLQTGAWTPVSFYESAKFGTKCPQVPGAQGGVSPSENHPIFFGKAMADNWIAVRDVGSLEDLEDWDRSFFASKGARSNQEILDLALRKCGGACVKKEGRTYYLNKPGFDCAKHNSLLNLETPEGGHFKVYIQSVCPARHWKNLLKVSLGDDNWCSKAGGGAHVDLEVESFVANGLFRKEDQSALRVRLRR